mmetsp:Transcript_22608/g.34141  ORF Transcript_22608/g.34141 Transcript_22608/m.34141 type:complete len:120 (+) Transcript_22608:4-363(+)
MQVQVQACIVGEAAATNTIHHNIIQSVNTPSNIKHHNNVQSRHPPNRPRPLPHRLHPLPTPHHPQNRLPLRTLRPPHRPPNPSISLPRPNQAEYRRQGSIARHDGQWLSTIARWTICHF